MISWSLAVILRAIASLIPTSSFFGPVQETANIAIVKKCSLIFPLTPVFTSFSSLLPHSDSPCCYHTFHPTSCPSEPEQSLFLEGLLPWLNSQTVWAYSQHFCSQSNHVVLSLAFIKADQLLSGKRKVRFGPLTCLTVCLLSVINEIF